MFLPYFLNLFYTLLSASFAGQRIVEGQRRGHNGRAEARMIHVQRGQFRLFSFISKHTVLVLQ